MIIGPAASIATLFVTILLLLPLTPNQYCMRKIVVLLSITVLFACRDAKEDFTPPENGLDAGRQFIDNSLKGRFTTAKKYMLKTEENNFWIDKVSKEYNQYSEKDKAGYSSASINIKEIIDLVPDSVVIINYSNSYVNRAQKLKVIKYNGTWQVDLNYTFGAN